MIYKDYYKILGLESNRVSKEQIKIAYRAQAKKYHPDVNVKNSKNEEIFKDINEAYRILSDSSSKRKYDRVWRRNLARKNDTTYKPNSRKEGDSIAGDFLKMVFGNVSEEGTKSIIPKKGEDIETEIDVSIADAFRGKNQSVGLKTASGRIKKYTVNIPAGIKSGEKVRLKGQGKDGINGGSKGDLIIKINVKNDRRFKLTDNDLTTNLYLTPWEAMFGTKLTVKGIDEEVVVYVPAGIQSGEKIALDEKGYIGQDGVRGKLYLDTRIMIPEKPSEEEKELFKKLEKESKFNPRV